jgi:hypothetical protein
MWSKNHHHCMLHLSKHGSMQEHKQVPRTFSNCRSTQAGTENRGNQGTGGAAFTCWVAKVGTEDDNPHAVAADDGEDADGGANEDAPTRSKTVALRTSLPRNGTRTG